MFSSPSAKTAVECASQPTINLVIDNDPLTAIPMAVTRFTY
jgi:hypothetical protein